MNFVTVDFNLNQFFSVQESAFKEVIKYSFLKTKTVKLVNEPRISFEFDKMNIHIFLEIKVKSDIEIDNSIKEITKNIEQGITNLIDTKPKNIQFNIVGFL
ncbi:hypothetical protein HUN03_00355 [Mycoplasmopsis anatis]|uniref:Asp23/Gls24 family envelope stress response protein n=2 Tax=Mycoplasmopsis anatis TaxID=171279 RepID=F9QEJ0_9BACT|nr:hypothetical protein [Mycoplasmopsis anatis]AWX69975.1 hypothetical protein DP067_01130 [Mycoplasmopsis anatis]EGS28840.1 hypothetical protein GIG_04049 [Mycoplasmopsis anatis 1340]MBW0595312.1 hypothetical protein [Mycoplasmopsis anatis]MBW0596114.1 hypothetical protein [Mycoplasmopsis anatis]MBW0596798.1 hypothetical protein [Mycoplasmopsis anatis]